MSKKELFMKVEDRIFSDLISPYDVRDYKLATVVDTDFPDVLELPSVAVKDQGSVGSCVAHACSSIIEYHNKRQEKTTTLFSTEFIYGYRPAGYYVGEGMYLRDALKTLQKVGDPPLPNFRGNNKCPEAMKNVEAQLEPLKDLAYPHRISSYVRVRTVDEIKHAIIEYGYVLVSMPWHVDYKLKNGVYTYTSKETRGNHCVCIYGWDERGWLVHNSWGRNWGQRGKFVVPFDFKWNEAWAIIDNIEGEGDIKRPEDNWFIRTFSIVINAIANFFRKLFKKI
jgi:hypothetical protein